MAGLSGPVLRELLGPQLKGVPAPPGRGSKDAGDVREATDGSFVVPPGVSGAQPPRTGSALPPKDCSKGFGSWVSAGFFDMGKNSLSLGRGGGGRRVATSLAGFSVFATISAWVLVSAAASAGRVIMVGDNVQLSVTIAAETTKTTLMMVRFEWVPHRMK